MKILIIEDDENSANHIAKSFKQHGHIVDTQNNGRDGLFLAAGETYDVMVIDRMLPRLDGLSLIHTLRTDGDNTPVLVLSALGDVDDRVQGLHSGADDYLVKPFSMAELLARLEVLHRRSRAPVADTQTTLQVEDLSMNLLKQHVQRQDVAITLQPREYKLLEYLMRHAGQVVTRAMLLEHVWGYHFDPQTNVIDVHVSRLRQKIDRDFDQPLLATVRGTGYRLGPETAS